MIERSDPARFKHFLKESQAQAERRYKVYQQLAGISVPYEAKDENGNDENGNGEKEDK